jgi:hypothetical protein
MYSSVSPKDESWFLRVCQHISKAVYQFPGPGSAAQTELLIVSVGYVFGFSTKRTPREIASSVSYRTSKATDEKGKGERELAGGEGEVTFHL